jgi:hypothetical protein
LDFFCKHGASFLCGFKDKARIQIEGRGMFSLVGTLLDADGIGFEV